MLSFREFILSPLCSSLPPAYGLGWGKGINPHQSWLCSSILLNMAFSFFVSCGRSVLPVFRLFSELVVLDADAPSVCMWEVITVTFYSAIFLEFFLIFNGLLNFYCCVPGLIFPISPVVLLCDFFLPKMVIFRNAYVTL